MADYQCPFCGELNGRWLDEISQDAPDDYYRCKCCYHVWKVPKRTPADPPLPVPPPTPPFRK